MEPITIIIIFLLVVFIGGIISHFQRSKKLAGSPTYKRIDKMDKENFPEVTKEYKLEDLNNLRTHWRNNGLEFSDPQFQELYRISIQDENGNFSVSKRSMDLNLKFHGHEEQVYIIIDCYYNLGNIMHIYSKNQPLLDSLEKAFKQAKESENQ